MTVSILFFLCMVFSACSADQEQINPEADQDPHQRLPVVTGAENLIDRYLDKLDGKAVGLAANPTSRVGTSHLLDTLISRNVDIRALFAAEHGFRGDQPAGQEIRDGHDVETGFPVYSLYGATRKPTPEMLEGIDVLIFDMQDVGVRFYTYISTLGLILEAAAENDVKVMVLDRPNPLGGVYISGWMLEDEFKSFVGAFPIPVAHGMTIGELAAMMVGEQWLNTTKFPDLEIIPMRHWNRNMIWPDTGLDWYPPSPNLPHFTNALVYPGTCFIEGTNMSEGRGTHDPFMKVGSPTLDLPDEVIERLASDYYILIERITFTPESIQGMAHQPKHEDKEVKGLRITPQTLNPVRLRPVEFGLELLREMLNHDPEARTKSFLYNLSGTRKIDDFLQGSDSPEEMWEEETERFRELREEYLKYE